MQWEGLMAELANVTEAIAALIAIVYLFHGKRLVDDIVRIVKAIRGENA
jgi:hypothetical protein